MCLCNEARQNLMWGSLKSEIGKFSAILFPPTKCHRSGAKPATNHSAEWMMTWDEFERRKFDVHYSFSLNFYYLPYTSIMIQFLRYCHLKVDQLLHIAIRLEF